MRTRSLIGAALGMASASPSGRPGDAAGPPLVKENPEEADLPDGIDELLEADRLDDVGVDAEPVAFDEVPLLPRGRQHDDGEVSQRLVGLDPAQYLQAVHPRHLQVEQEDRRIPRGALRAAAAPEQVIE